MTGSPTLEALSPIGVQRYSNCIGHVLVNGKVLHYAKSTLTTEMTTPTSLAPFFLDLVLP